MVEEERWDAGLAQPLDPPYGVNSAYVIPNLQGNDWHCVGRICLQSVTRRFLAWWLDHNKSYPDRRGTCSSLAASPEEVSGSMYTSNEGDAFSVRGRALVSAPRPWGGLERSLSFFTSHSDVVISYIMTVGDQLKA